MENNEKKEELTSTTDNNEEQKITEQKEIKEENNKESQINNTSSNNFKPRKWLLNILIIITIALVGFIVYETVFSIKASFSNSSGSWGIFNSFKRSNSDEDETKDIINQDQNQVSEDNNTTINIQEEVTNKREELNKNSFNGSLELRMGTQYLNSISLLLDDVITNNKKHKDYLITVVFKNISTTNPEEIKNLKKQFEEWHKYEVSLDYDEEGYVNKVTIEE